MMPFFFEVNVGGPLPNWILPPVGAPGPFAAADIDWLAPAAESSALLRRPLPRPSQSALPSASSFCFFFFFASTSLMSMTFCLSTMIWLLSSSEESA